MKFNKSGMLAATACIWVLGLPTVALAQSQDVEASDEVAGESEIVVTALKRSQSVQDVPASISVLSGDSMAERGIADVRDISKVVPNLIWGEHFGTTLITIRGAGSNVDSGATEPTVALYVDGIYLPRSDMATFRAVDLDRVEVLRGPQGTLYGRNATGGAINMISQAPTDELTGRVTLSAGQRDEIGVSGYVSGSITPGISVRLSGGREKQDGYLTVVNTGQKLGGLDTRYGRLAVRIAPEGSSVVNDISIRYERNTAAVASQQPLDTPVFPAGVFTLNPRQILADSPYSGERETFIASNLFTIDLSDNVTLKSLTGYIDHNSHAEVDADGSLVPFQYVDDFVRTSESFSQEFNLIGTSGKLDWILGLYYFNEKYFGNLPVIIQAGLAPTLGLPIDATINLGQTAKINNYAGFADLTYNVSDRLKLNVGLRLNHEDNEYSQIFSLPPVVPESSADFTIKQTKLIPKVAVNYELTSNVQTYAQWTRGYKSGGANLPSGSGAFLPLYRPEEIDAFEVGLKAQNDDRTLTFNTAAWYYSYSDLQVTTSVPPNTTLVRNADARLYGIEAELRWRPVGSLEVAVAPTFQHARFRNFITFDSVTASTIDLSGEPIPRAPDFLLNGSLANTFDLGNGFLSSLRVEANALHSSSVVLRYENTTPASSQKAYTVANFSGTLTDKSGKTRLTAFLNNAFNELYAQQSLNFGLGDYGNYAPPRTWGVRLSRDF